MILRRLYLYIVSAAALVLLAIGLTFLGTTVLLFVFNDPNADSSRSQLAIFTAMTVVALPVWGVHFWFARRFAMRDPFERASAIRRLYLYWASFVSSIAAAEALQFTLGQAMAPFVDNQNVSNVITAQLGWATLVFAAIFAFHFQVAARDRAAVGEEGGSATLRRWYMYAALFFGLLVMLTNSASILMLGLTSLANNAAGRSGGMSFAVAGALSGALLWGFHARVIATRHITQDRHSTLRAIEGFLAVAISIGAALVGASQILYYGLARLLGVSHPGGTTGNLVADAAGPVSQVLVFGVAWFLLQRRITRDAVSQEADRQAGVRRLYTNLASLVSLAAWAVGAGGLLWNLFEQIEAPIIGVTASDWKDPVSLWVTLLVVGLVVWIAHWRQSPWAADRQSLSRKLYVWAALLGSILAVLAGGVGMINALFQQLFSAHPSLASRSNLDFGHFLAVILVGAGVGVYHLRVLRADAAARPARPAPVQPVVTRPVAVANEAAPAPAAAETLAPHSRRYSLVVSDATDDDIHQALSSLPPHASYKLTPTETAVDGH